MRPRKTPSRAGLILAGLLILAAFLVIWRWPRPSGSSSARSGRLSGLNLGGRGIQFELFDPGGRARLWRLDLGEIVWTSAGIIEGRTVRADFFGAAAPGRLTADALRYAPDRSRLVFLGGVRLDGGGFTLSCRELAWDRRAHTFAATGGYKLIRGSSAAEGRELTISEDWRTIRSTGPSSLRVPAGGGTP